MLLRFFRIDKLNDGYWDSEEFLCELESDFIPQIGSYATTKKDDFSRKVIHVNYIYYEEEKNNRCDICLLTNSEFEKYLNDEYNLNIKEEC